MGSYSDILKRGAWESDKSWKEVTRIRVQVFREEYTFVSHKSHPFSELFDE